MAGERPRLAEHTASSELIRLLGSAQLAPELVLVLASILRRLDNLDARLDDLEIAAAMGRTT